MIPGLLSFTFPMMGKFQTIAPAIKNEIASTSKPQPAPTVDTRIPPPSVPRMYPKLVVNPITALPSCNFSFGNISGRTPDIAGHQIALRIPKSAPISASNQVLEKPTMSEIALRAARKLPIMSLPPTRRLRWNLSAMTPPKSMNASSGTKRAAMTIERSLPVELGRLSTP